MTVITLCTVVQFGVVPW
uniref:Uncharacterized protein n=1 Tax=Anguilla anguilla TaxID=7936 RepID=A0A0E9UWA4_ANGAN